MPWAPGAATKDPVRLRSRTSAPGFGPETRRAVLSCLVGWPELRSGSVELAAVPRSPPASCGVTALPHDFSSAATDQGALASLSLRIVQS